MILQGRAVRLEPLTLDHVDALVVAASESAEHYALTWVPRTTQEARLYVEEALRTAMAGTAMPFATLLEGRVVGSTRFGNIERWAIAPGVPAPKTAPPDVVEIGWTWLAASAQRTAANTEAKLLMLTHAFEAWRVKRVALKTDARNARSRVAIERLGAKFEGVLRAHMPAFDRPGPRDSALYSIVGAEWPQVKATLTARLDRSLTARETDLGTP